ncbi:MarR family winged helix-turn-helix transcriptional regulator [Pararobbsia silviterrae]|uniref:MarR family transcriptional regulator n=1 Tax=Pararobbsia silviterrae TaxID=1792498 RepID=A0A494XI77_9BURK|nr:MarR family transcriptional regulator [Pararobbsia silviterrae]RKP50248.1 MarR family transcriptional regulator [Pararobbsia silviterrae]
MDELSPPTSVEFAASMEDSIGYLLARVRSNLWNAVTQQTMQELGVTATQASMLSMLASGQCLAAAELARQYGIDASAVTRLLDRLEKRGLLVRVRSQDDRRVVKLRLTEQGTEFAERMPALYSDVVDKLLRGFAPDEVGLLRAMLKRMLVNSNEPA